MIDGDPVEADEIHVTVLNKALPVFYIKPVGAGAQDDGSWNTEQQARDVLERLMALLCCTRAIVTVPSMNSWLPCAMSTYTANET